MKLFAGGVAGSDQIAEVNAWSNCLLWQGTQS